jgi:nanoRNase/pAp phosphatase (c-di-AMP/oligoRNAs hydrolase)
MGEATKKFRLITRSDFDGLVCAVLLKHLNLIDEIKFVHPKDMQDGKVEVTANDITTNLPYVAGAHLAFDHHLSETVRTGKHENHIIEAEAPSAARVVYNYYGGAKAFPSSWDDMMTAVDVGDAAQFTKDDIMFPSEWSLLNMVMDARTGLGRFKDFTKPNYQLMMDLIDACRTLSIDEILELPDVKERVELYFQQDQPFKEQIRRCGVLHKKLVVLDLRNEQTVHVGNRFMVYALFPQSNISMHVIWGMKKMNTVFAIGKSILDRSSKTNVGALCLEFGGGGHEAAGTCQVPNEEADATMQKLIARITADG